MVTVPPPLAYRFSSDNASETQKVPGRETAGNATKARAEHHGQIDDVRPPAENRHSAKISLNCFVVIQRCWSTMPRRAQTNTPPKPASDILANAKNRPG